MNFKKVLGRVFDSLVERDVLGVSYARQAAGWILSENAKELYKLK